MSQNLELQSKGKRLELWCVQRDVAQSCEHFVILSILFYVMLWIFVDTFRESHSLDS